MSDSLKRMKTDAAGDLNKAEGEQQSINPEVKNAEVPYPSRRKPKANASADLDLAVRRVGGVPLDISDFYFEEEKSLRKVRPYFYNYKSSVKHRWIGQSIEKLMRSEFSRSDECELVVGAGVEDLSSTLIGSFRVNGQPVAGDYVLKNGDKLEHIVHRHENPILTDPIRIVSETEELLAIDKPSSVPIHACGRYCLNSALHIMARDMDRLQLRNVHRLDRLTSGIVILAKQQRSAMLLAKQIRSRRVRKVYLCKVYGEFPRHVDELLTAGFSSESILRVSDAQAFKVKRSSSTSGSSSASESDESQAPLQVSQMQDSQIEADGEPIVCDATIARVSPRIGVHFVPPSGDELDPLASDGQCGPKPCRTLFRRVAYCPSSHTSLVRCEPLTGRTHQIRVHAQYLGYPLVGDPIYGAPVWGTNRGRLAQYDVRRAQLGEALYAHHARIGWFVGTRIDEAHIKLAAGHTVELAKVPGPNPDAAEWLPRTDDDAAKLRAVGAPLKYFTFEQSCPDCRLVFRDPTREELTMCLHALEYTGPQWHFRTQLPSWATPFVPRSNSAIS